MSPGGVGGGHAPGDDPGFPRYQRWIAAVEGPAEITNPQVGDEIGIGIRVACTVEVRQVWVLCRYQAEFFEFVGAFAGEDIGQFGSGERARIEDPPCATRTSRARPRVEPLSFT